MSEHISENTIVQAWIKDYQAFQNKVGFKTTYSTCKYCGFPHRQYDIDHHTCGNVFGMVRLGGEYYWIDKSNVEYMLYFVQTQLGTGFHWKAQIYFSVEDENVIVTHLSSYNNTPHKNTWTIPLLEWKSITDEVERLALAKP